MLLLLLHFPEDGIFLDLDEVPALLLAKAKPKILDALALFRGACTPNFIWRWLSL